MGSFCAVESVPLIVKKHRPEPFSIFHEVVDMLGGVLHVHVVIPSAEEAVEIADPAAVPGKGNGRFRLGSSKDLFVDRSFYLLVLLCEHRRGSQEKNEHGSNRGRLFLFRADNSLLDSLDF